MKLFFGFVLTAFIALPPLFAESVQIPVGPELCIEEGYSSGAQGKVIFKVLNADLRVRQDEVSDFKYVLEQVAFIRESTGTAFARHMAIFDSCVALSSAGVAFKSERLNYSPRLIQEPEWRIPTIVGGSRASFQDQCLDKMPTEDDRGRIENIVKNFPQTYPFNVWKQGLDLRMENCRLLIQPLCKNTDPSQNPLTVSVPVKCEVRKISKNELSDPKEKYSSEYLKTLNLCAGAKDYGYMWIYEVPPLPKDCGKKKSLKPKSR